AAGHPEIAVARQLFPNTDSRIARSGADADVARLEATGLNAYFGQRHTVKDVTLALEPRSVTAIIGPSGCGKSTLLRCLNRMHETVPGARTTGSSCTAAERAPSPCGDTLAWYSSDRLRSRRCRFATTSPPDSKLGPARRRARASMRSSRMHCAAPHSGTKSRTG